jgi:hypothetical protein
MPIGIADVPTKTSANGNCRSEVKRTRLENGFQESLIIREKGPRPLSCCSEPFTIIPSK